MSQLETILFEQIGAVAKITLNRPDAANGINLPMAQELLQTAIRCDEDPTVRAVIITANGKMFSAGGDLKSFAQYGEQISSALKQLTLYLHGAITRFARMDAPVIVAVNGMAAGAGFSLAVAGDMVLAADSAKFTMAYTAAGLSPDGSASYYLPRLIGLRKTQELMLTNRRLSAQEAMDWGMINRVEASDELQQATMTLANQLANGPTMAFGVVKKLLQDSFTNSLETQLETEARGIAGMTKLADGQEGIEAFLAKRAPEFKGC